MWDFLLEQWNLLAQPFGAGLPYTIGIFALTLLFSIPLGLVVAALQLSGKRIFVLPMRLYVLVVRGTPLMLQLIFVYFAPYYIFGAMNLYDRFTAVVIAFSLNYAAYFAEIFRGGILSIPVGQYEAASVLGFNRRQTFFHIILPQVIKRVLPPMSNEVITLVKDTALAQVIGISELLRAAQNVSSRTANITPLFAAGGVYLLLNFVVTRVLGTAEKRLSYYK